MVNLIAGKTEPEKLLWREARVHILHTCPASALTPLTQSHAGRQEDLGLPISGQSFP